MPNLRIFAVNESFFLRNALYFGCLCADGSGGDIVYMSTDMRVSGNVIALDIVCGVVLRAKVLLFSDMRK